jgi:hypothetical protein
MLIEVSSFNNSHQENAMQQFIARFRDMIQGVVSGFDRLLFRGSLRQLNHAHGMEVFLYLNNILFKDYDNYVKGVSRRLKQASIASVLEQKLPVEYLRGGDTDKDGRARQIAAERGITSGDVCVLSALELAPTFQHEGTHMVIRKRPSLALYHYLIHPEFGWMFAHIQTWFPFAIHVYLNGREWLARQMEKEELGYVRQDNCFPWIEDYGRAQELLDAQLKVNWEACLSPFAQRLNPLHREIFAKFNTNYYWTVPQCEWATDIVFQPGALERLTPRFLEHGMLSFSSPDVMQFLGKKIRLDGQIPEGFDGELTTDFKRRRTGERIKHRLNGNSLKCYGKAHTQVGDVFRVETTTNQVEQFRVYRPKEGGPEEDLQWRQMRRGVADLHRRAEVSQKANERYLNALSTVDDSTRLSELIRQLERPCRLGKQRLRALHPFSAEDHALLQVINCGEFALNGLRNRDLQALLFKQDASVSPAEKRRRSAQVSRQLRLLRAHGLIQKVPRTHRYQVTTTGRLIITAILTADRTSLSQLNKIAA